MRNKSCHLVRSLRVSRVSLPQFVGVTDTLATRPNNYIFLQILRFLLLRFIQILDESRRLIKGMIATPARSTGRLQCCRDVRAYGTF